MNEHLTEEERKDRLDVLAKDVFSSLFGTDVPKDCIFSSESELFSDVSKRLAKHDYSYEKMTLPQCTDIATEQKIDDYIVKAYYNSDAFADRAAWSLGYVREDDMTAEDRAVFNRIVQRGKEVTSLVRDDSVNPESAYSWANESYSIDDNDPWSKAIGMSIVGHEMGHFLYNGHSDGLNPGKQMGTAYRNVTLSEETQKYGKEDSPLNTINEDETDFYRTKRMLKAAGILDKDKLKAEKKVLEQKPEAEKWMKGYFGTKDLNKAVILFNMEHDNEGIERGADVHGVRLLMLKEGIWNPFDGSKVNEDQIRLLAEKHPECRIFNYWDQEKSMFYLNNIASADKVSDDNSVRMTVNVNGNSVNMDMTQSEQVKLMAMDDYHKLRIVGSKLQNVNIDSMSDEQKNDMLDSIKTSIYPASTDKMPTADVTERKGEQANSQTVDASLLAQSNYSREMDIMEGDSQTQEHTKGMSV